MGKSSRRRREKTLDNVSNGSAILSEHTRGLSQQNVTSGTQKVDYYLAASISAITFVVYLLSLRNEFVLWDDDVYVYLNQHITTLNVDFFRWAFFDFYAGNWHPLTWISHALDYAVWGLNPLGHHLTNNIIHSINSFLVVVLVIRIAAVYQNRILSEGSTTFIDRRRLLVIGGVTGLLFGLHPIHVESVTWISERKDVLCALFFLLSIMVYTAYARRACKNSPGEEASRFLNTRYLLSLCFFILALLSKPMAVSLPAVLIILDWFPFGRIRSLKSLGDALVEKTPFIALALLSAVVTIQAQKLEGAMSLMELVPLPTRLLVAVNSLVGYLEKMLVPMGLCPFYPYPKNASLFSLKYLFVIVLVSGISIACVALLKKQKLWLSIWSYYLVTLVPVIGVVQVGEQAMADRYSYLPSLGPFFMMGLLVAWSSSKVDRLEKKRAVIKRFGIAALVFLLSTTMYLTSKQIDIWKDSMTLWSYVIKKEPDSVPRAYYNRGIIFGKLGSLDKAMADFDKAVTLNPSYSEAYSNRGIVFGKLGKLDKAMADFDKAITLKPSYANAYYNRALAHRIIGQFDQEAADFQRACELGETRACTMLQTLKKR